VSVVRCYGAEASSGNISLKRALRIDFRDHSTARIEMKDDRPHGFSIHLNHDVLMATGNATDLKGLGDIPLSEKQKCRLNSAQVPDDTGRRLANVSLVDYMVISLDVII
jgi:hypothetical protein